MEFFPLIGIYNFIIGNWEELDELRTLWIGLLGDTYNADVPAFFSFQTLVSGSKRVILRKVKAESDALILATKNALSKQRFQFQNEVHTVCF